MFFSRFSSIMLLRSAASSVVNSTGTGKFLRAPRQTQNGRQWQYLPQSQPQLQPLLFLHTHIRCLDSSSTRTLGCKSCASLSSAEDANASSPRIESGPLVRNVPPSRSLAFWTDVWTWRRSSINTLHCLVGCSIGDLSALFIFANYFPRVSMAVVMPVAMASGIMSSTTLETLRLKYTLPALSWRGAVSTTLNMSFLSMLTMEAAENATNMLVAQSMASSGNATNTDLQLAAIEVPSSLSTMLMMDTQNPYFLPCFALSTLAGFLAPLPYNYYVVRRYNKQCH